MSAVLATRDIPAILGTPFEGGFYFGRIHVDRHPHAIVVASKMGGEHPDAVWNRTRTKVAGALSYYDSMANTLAMAEAGSEIAKWALAQKLNGLTDWCIPARDVLEVIHRHGKPHPRANYCYYRSGENPSSIPVGYPYTEADPAQTVIEAFKAGGAEAMDEVVYWSSTQYEAYSDSAWAQYFYDGDQYYFRKVDEYRVRLVRLIPI